jgi:ribosomal protein L24
MIPRPWTEGDEVVITQGKYKGLLATVIGVWGTGTCVVELLEDANIVTWAQPEHLDCSENQDSYQEVAD